MNEHKTARQIWLGRPPGRFPSWALDAIKSDDAEIKRLQDRVRELESVLDAAQAMLRRYRTETPLGHQPHMIAHQADEVIAEAAGLLEGREDG